LISALPAAALAIRACYFAPMLHEVITANREEILALARAKGSDRPAPPPSPAETKHGAPLFLDQLAAALRLAIPSSDEIGKSATRHGDELLRKGFTLAQVVHEYGDLGEAVLEHATGPNGSITTEELHILTRCLGDATARAVTEYAEQRDRGIASVWIERLGSLSHELRNLLFTAIIAFDEIKERGFGEDGSTGGVLRRSLLRLGECVDRAAAEVRIDARVHRPERFSLGPLIEEASAVATLEANARNLQLTVAPVEAGIEVEADRPVLAAAVANLLNNALKFTRPHTHVWLKTRATADRVRIDVEDECGGLPGKADDLFHAFEQRGKDRSGIGLGLTISRRGVEACGGKILVSDLLGKGCVFTIDLPRVPLAT
jgi:signal transduction histidine kinase